MTPSNTRSLPPLDQATPDDLNEALAHWEDLDEASLARLLGHPESSSKLSALRRVEAWMESGGLEDARAGGPVANSTIAGSSAPSTCPPAEDLFDFARAQSGNEAVETHLEHCDECSELVGSLAGHPPSPLILCGEEDGSPSELDPAEVRVGLRPLGRRSVWPPILAAAGLAGLALIPRAPRIVCVGPERHVPRPRAAPRGRADAAVSRAATCSLPHRAAAFGTNFPMSMARTPIALRSLRSARVLSSAAISSATCAPKSRNSSVNGYPPACTAGVRSRRSTAWSQRLAARSFRSSNMLN